MSTNKTTNLNLHSWERTDVFRMEEFNENFEAIDKAVGEHTAALEGKVDAETLSAELANKADVTYAAKIYKGSYTGSWTTGTKSHTITFPFTPKLVFFDPSKLTTLNINGSYDPIIMWDVTITYRNNEGPGTITYENNSMTITSDFASVQFNEAGKTYYYVAIG